MEKEKLNSSNLSKKLTISALVIASYVAVMFVTQSFAFGAVQVRIATALYSLSYMFPFLVLPMGISNLIANMTMGGLGIYDTLGGLLVGVIVASIILLIRKQKLPKFLVVIPIILGPGLLVPIWLSKILGIPYSALALSICLGQIIPAIIGLLLITYLERGENNYER